MVLCVHSELIFRCPSLLPVNALASPLRRCLLTNKVLPRDLLVRFELVKRSNSVNSPTSSHLHLVPSGIIHPRFVVNSGTRGKGLWVTCWKEAVEALAKKGSYKRLNSSAYLDPAFATTRVHSHLARRVAQETEMFAERAKSWPARLDGDVQACPVRRVSRDELMSGRGSFPDSLQQHGARPVAVLDLTVPEGGVVLSTLSHFTPFQLDDGQRRVPLYELAAFLARARLPPARGPPAKTAGTDEAQPPPPQPATKADVLRDEMQAHLQSVIALWERRMARQARSRTSPPPPPSSPSPSTASSDDLYVLYSPIIPLTPPPPPSPDSSTESSSSAPPSPPSTLAIRQAEDVVPLLLALKRCALWLGEGWEAGSA
ncbi:hypothetical protein JCM8097_006221 [Rhodosporidiobolus ruineniae]